MFVPFLIMLREGLEAALIVSLIASYLKRTQRGRWIGVMWIGVLLAAALCLGLGIFINETTGEFPQKEQELFEGIVAVIAVVILTWMVFWMRKVSRNVKVQLEQAVDSALQRGNHHGWALVMMVFFAVAREGLESVFFLLAAFQQDVGIWPPLGAMLGLATAVVLGFLLYWGGIRLNLGAFFKWTSLFILFVAAGLATGAIRAFHEAGLWNHFQEIAFDMSAELSLAVWHTDGRDFWLSGSTERQRSRRLVYLSHPGAGGICSATTRRGDCVPLRVANTTQTLA